LNGFRLLLPLLLLAGCSRFQHITHEFVYVSVRQVYLHDRVAAVSNRVGLVTNGEALEVVERGKRFTKVRTPKGEIGWLEDHAIIDDKLYAQFEDLDKKHSADPVISIGELRDDRYLHLIPGRETAHFLLVTANTKVQMLERGTVAKAAAPGALPAIQPASKPAGKPVTKPQFPAAGKSAAPEPAQPAPVPTEDWWLVRDPAGHTGWLLAGQVDVNLPDEIGEYAEGQRIVGAYPIAKVMDSGVEHERKAGKKASEALREKNSTASESAGDSGEAAGAPVPTEHTEFVTVLTPHGGLPYDFDQLRVFTWSLNHHRYETAYRLHGIQGYLPVKIGQDTVNGQTMPTFSFEIASGPNVNVDPDTGVTRPVAPRTLSFRLEGNLVRRIGPDMAPIILTHDADEPGKAKTAAKKKKH